MIFSSILGYLNINTVSSFSPSCCHKKKIIRPVIIERNAVAAESILFILIKYQTEDTSAITTDNGIRISHDCNATEYKGIKLSHLNTSALYTIE